MSKCPTILVWNCHGVGNENFHRIINDMVTWHRPNMLILVETHISGNKLNQYPLP